MIQANGDLEGEERRLDHDATVSWIENEQVNTWRHFGVAVILYSYFCSLVSKDV